MKILHNRFNPLDRGNLYLIIRVSIDYFNPSNSRFNPLDRGNLYLIIDENTYEHSTQIAFQSPRSGKFVSNNRKKAILAMHRHRVSIP